MASISMKVTRRQIACGGMEKEVNGMLVRSPRILKQPRRKRILGFQ